MSDKNVIIKEEDIIMNLKILEDNGEVSYANQEVGCALLSKRKRDTSELDIQKNECSVDKKANIQAKVVKPEAGIVKSDETGNGMLYYINTVLTPTDSLAFYVYM